MAGHRCWACLLPRCWAGTITYAVFATVETLVGRLTAARVGWRLSVPLGTAALAISLDLILGV
jgi:hypothetical protein